MQTEQSPTIQKLGKLSSRLLSFSPLEHAEAKRMLRLFISLVHTPVIGECTMNSILLAAANSTKLGLSPDPQLGHIYFVPFKNKQGDRELTIIIGYKGYMELAHRSGFIKAIRANLVYENDDFEYADGWDVELFHRPWWLRKPPQSAPGKIRAAYVVTDWKDGGKRAGVYPIFELEKSRERSKAKNKGPWVTDYESMILKSALLRDHKFWSLSPQQAKAVSLDMRADLGEPQGNGTDMEEIIEAEPVENGKHEMFPERKPETVAVKGGE